MGQARPALLTGSALWTYIATPFIFATPGYELHELAPWEQSGEVWRRLAVTFPTELHTHSRQQVFYFGADGLLRRQDYTAEEFGERANAAHYCFEHREFGGLVFPTRRRVFPRRPDDRPRRHPLLVWIDIQAVDVGPVDGPTRPAGINMIGGPLRSDPEAALAAGEAQALP